MLLATVLSCLSVVNQLVRLDEGPREGTIEKAKLLRSGALENRERMKFRDQVVLHLPEAAILLVL